MTTRSEVTNYEDLIRRAMTLHRIGQKNAPDWEDERALEAQLAEMQALANTGQFSIRQIAKVAGVSMARARQLQRPEGGMAGGLLNPDSLPRILSLIHSEDIRAGAGPISRRSVLLAKEIAEQGTSVYVLERLSGIPETTLRRWIAMELDSEAQR